MLATEGAPNWETFSLPWGGFVFSSSACGDQYNIFVSEENGMTVSHVVCYHDLTAEGEGSVPFGRFQARLYERNDITELHLLDMAYPRSGRYHEKYAGKYYTLRAGKER